MKNINQFLYDLSFLNNRVLIYILFLTSCSQNKIDNSEKSFNFYIQYNNFEYDSKSSMYKKLILRPEKDSILELKVVLSENDRLKILNVFKQSNFFSFRENCSCGNISAEPRYFCKIKYLDNITSKTVVFNYSANDNENYCKKSKRFNSIRDSIMLILKKDKIINDIERKEFILTD